MGQIFGHYTCTRVKWECEDESCEHFGCVDYPVEEHGWVEQCNSRTLYEHRNYVRAVINLDESEPELADEIRDALGWLEGGFDDNHDGTFYSSDSYHPFDEPWHYSYALHFTRKFLGPKGWTEEPWHPVTDGGIKL